jgi:hypothetical protein
MSADFTPEQQDAIALLAPEMHVIRAAAIRLNLNPATELAKYCKRNGFGYTTAEITTLNDLLANGTI